LDIAQGDPVRPCRPGQFDGLLDQGLAQIAVMIGIRPRTWARRSSLHVRYPSFDVDASNIVYPRMAHARSGSFVLNPTFCSTWVYGENPRKKIAVGSHDRFTAQGGRRR
jgi:hypothetical protein